MKVKVVMCYCKLKFVSSCFVNEVDFREYNYLIWFIFFVSFESIVYLLNINKW